MAWHAAEAAGRHAVDLAARDCDVPLSPLGEQQAAALGEWVGKLPKDERPTVVLTSPYLRARTTADIVVARAGLAPRGRLPYIVDERLREREFGILDGLTRHGVQEKHPEQAELKTVLGKFYHRPPGGESWCDVILRLRNVVDTITREHRRERVLIVCHAVVVLCFRYLLEEMTEEEILAIDRAEEIANCSVTSYHFDPEAGVQGKVALRLFNFVAALEEAGAEVTKQADAVVAPR